MASRLEGAPVAISEVKRSGPVRERVAVHLGPATVGISAPVESLERPGHAYVSSRAARRFLLAAVAAVILITLPMPDWWAGFTCACVVIFGAGCLAAIADTVPPS